MPQRSRRAGSVTAAAVGTALLLGACGTGGSPRTAGVTGSSPVVSTTKIAGAGVLGNQRRPDESCAPAPAAPDSPAPQRIVALATDQLDALCALGLQDRIVAAALPDGPGGQPGAAPSYLGRTIHDLPAVGTETTPDLAAIAEARPDLILGSQVTAGAKYPALAAIAPTVLTGAPGAGWQDVLRAVGAATGQGPDADRLIGDFETAADQAGAQDDATHFQASVVQLTDSTLRVYGTANFPGSVLAAVGADRPAAQRFTDTPFKEIGLGPAGSAPADLSAADGDIVYVSFASPAARDHAAAVLDGPAWKKLSAARDNRVFAVNDEVWQTGEGLVAARGILADLRLLNAPIN